MAICQIFVKLLSVQPEGVLAALMKAMGMAPVAVLSDPKLALLVVSIIDGYKFCGIYMVIFYSAFLSVDQEVIEAAYIDGCSHSRTFWQIMLPLVQPAIITVTIFNFMTVWNEFFMALIFTTSDSMTPVGVGLLQIVNAMKYSGQYGAMFAAVIIVFMPTFLLYLFLSEKIIVGATSGGVKG